MLYVYVCIHISTFIYMYMYICIHELMACQGLWANHKALESFMGTTKSINICEHL